MVRNGLNPWEVLTIILALCRYGQLFIYRRRGKIHWAKLSRFSTIEVSWKYFRVVLAISANYLVQLKRGAYDDCEKPERLAQ